MLGGSGHKDDAQPVAVEVKPLVWREEWLGERETPVWRGYDVGGVAQAYISFAGQYEIELHSEVPAWEIEQHKARKQADYASRILSAINVRPEVEVKAEGMRAAAKLIEARRDDYIAEHGSTEWDTGVMNFPGNGAETVGEWEELIELISAEANRLDSPRADPCGGQHTWIDSPPGYLRYCSQCGSIQERKEGE